MLRNYWMEYGIRACRRCGDYKDLSLMTKSWHRKLNMYQYSYCVECTREICRISAKTNYTVPRKRSEETKARRILETKNLADNYILKLLCCKSSLSYSDIPRSLIKIKRQQLKLFREARK